MAPDQAEFTPGEIQRSLARLEKGFADLTAEVRDRHHGLTDEINGAIGPISILKLQVEQHKQDLILANAEIERLDTRVEAVTNRVSWIVGVGVGVAFLIAKFLK